MKTKKIVVVLTNKGYVAVEHNQIFDLWKNKSLKEIYEELNQRYPTYKIHLGCMDQIGFEKAVEVSSQYLKEHEELKYIQTQNINHKNHSKMKNSSFNAETAATLAKVAAGFTTQKVLGALHLTVQTGADVLQYGANTVAKGEATVLTKLGIYNETYEDLITIRKERTKGYQNMVIQAPKNLLDASQEMGTKLKVMMANKNVKPVNL
ncbi:MAG: hypothetical protein Q8S41_03070 [Lutibacter sp.]|nr:hypothetical protein [Lutibacter sp.]